MSISPELARALSAVSCMECSEPFRLPKNPGEIESIECPHCHANLNMEQVLAEIAAAMNIPTASVVSGTSSKADAPGAAAASSTTDDSISTAPKISTADVEQSKPVKRNFDDENYFIPKPLKTAERPRHVSSRHSKARRKRQSEREFVKKPGDTGEWIRMVFGGLLAIPIAQLVLWWIFGIDPLALAPKAAEYVPIVVPQNLQPLKENDDDDDDDTELEQSTDMPENQKMFDGQVPQSINMNRR